MDYAKLLEAVEQGRVRARQHPDIPFSIFNYSTDTQHNKDWDEVTLQARGIIFDSLGNLVSRPFAKFFNWGDELIGEITEDFEVYRKMDGSMGISYFVEGVPYIASRGSFDSDQAIKANELLHNQYKHPTTQMNTQHTYLFEVIYPENRIVVDYKDTEALVLLGVIHTQSGEEMPLEHIGFPLASKVETPHDIDTLQSLNLENEEGYVIKFSNGKRCKVKFEDYFKIHQAVSQINSKLIWESLRNVQPILGLELIDEERLAWVLQVEGEILRRVSDLGQKISWNFYHLIGGIEFKVGNLCSPHNRGAVAQTFRHHPQKQLLFLLLDRDYKKYNSELYGLCRPNFVSLFSSSQKLYTP